jgi:phage baseplate assembly protein W
MGSLNFNSFKNTNHSQKNYTYTDIFLDLDQEPFEVIIGNRTIKGTGKDVKVAYDLNAVKNSIVNLFNTLPGERLLLPEYGCDLRRYIFEPISETNARFIGRTIKNSIGQWEPRVTIVRIEVDAYIDEQRYEVNLVMEAPFLQSGENFSLKGVLNQQGFTVI